MWNFTIVKIVVGFLVMIVLWVLASKILTSIAKSASKKDLGAAAKLASIGDVSGAKNVIENS